MSFFAVGALALGATGSAALTAGLAGAALEATAYGSYKQKKAADSAAQVDTATAAYNAKYDETMAAQLDLDTRQNILTQQAEDKVYLSRQEASYAAAGVLANTGSALDAQITNAGRFEQKIQQEWVNSNQKQQQYAAAAHVGILEGNARASADRMSGSIALINGGAKVLSLANQDYQSGVFSF